MNITIKAIGLGGLIVSAGYYYAFWILAFFNDQQYVLNINSIGEAYVEGTVMLILLPFMIYFVYKQLTE